MMAIAMLARSSRRLSVVIGLRAAEFSRRRDQGLWAARRKHRAAKLRENESQHLKQDQAYDHARQESA